MTQTVLLIDDSQSVHDLVCAVLDTEEITVNSAFEGETGVRMAAQSRPDLVLLDVDLPGMDGFEVYQQLAEHMDTMNVPVIFLTAASQSKQKVRGLNFGAVDYITKPFDADEFVARVKGSLRAKSRWDAVRSKRVDRFISRAMSRRAIETA